VAWKAISLSELVEWIDPFDPDPEDPTRWWVHAISSRMQGMIRDNAMSLVQDPYQPTGLTPSLGVHKRNRETVRFGLAKWERFLRPNDGKEIPVELEKVKIAGVDHEVVPDAVLDLIPIDVIQRLANLINELSNPPAEVLRKSPTPGAGGGAPPGTSLQ